MNITEAKAECQHWLDYLDRQRENSAAIQKISSDVRKGKCSEDDARRRIATIDHNPVVYDGAKLAEAVKTLLREVMS